MAANVVLQARPELAWANIPCGFIMSRTRDAPINGSIMYSIFSYVSCLQPVNLEINFSNLSEGSFSRKNTWAKQAPQRMIMKLSTVIVSQTYCASVIDRIFYFLSYPLSSILGLLPKWVSRNGRGQVPDIGMFIPSTNTFFLL